MKSDIKKLMELILAAAEKAEASSDFHGLIMCSQEYRELGVEYEAMPDEKTEST